jgi:hypothetical protein
MSDSRYEVRRIILENHDDVTGDLQAALDAYPDDGFEFVSCFPEPPHPSGIIHEVPTSDQGSNPYDAVWHTPTGPVFMAVFKRARDK